MLTIQLLSDLHLELHSDGGAQYIETLDPTGVDVLVLAGDILSLRFYTQAKARFKRLAEKYKKILYVPGNHEFWGMSIDEGFSVLDRICAEVPELIVLRNQVISIDGHRFLGGTMWFPRWPPTSDYAASMLPDFKEIKGFGSWVTMENARFTAFLKKNLQEGDVVVTHYLPSTKSVASRYRGSPLNDFFVSEMDLFILDRHPTLWIHGHTHFAFDYQFSKTRIVCNPRGYPGTENDEFVEKLLIPIS